MNILVFLLSVFVCEAEQPQYHYAHLPEGMAIVTVETKPVVRSVEIMGTINPPSLTINGQPATLKLAAIGKSTTGVWINNTSVRTEGSLGRFFTEYKLTDVQEKYLTVRIQQNAKTALEYIHPLTTIFLDYPQVATQTYSNVIGEPKEWQFSLTGQDEVAKYVMISAHLTAEGHKRKIQINAAEGDGTLTGRVIFPNGSKRVLRVPFSLKVRRGKKGDMVLSSYDDLDQLQDVPLKGKWISGVTNSNATIQLGNESAVADENGIWRVLLRPQQISGRMNIDVSWSQQVLQKSIEYKCSTCTQRDFEDHWELQFSYGLSMQDEKSLKSISPSLRHKSGWRFGLKDVSPTSRRENWYYYAFEGFLGYQIYKDEFPGRVWLEVGTFLRRREIQAMMGKDTSVSVGPYLRTEPWRFNKYVGVGAQADYMNNDKLKLWAFLNFNYSW